MSHEKTGKSFTYTLLMSIGVSSFAFLVVASCLYFYTGAYSDRIYPHIEIGGIPVSGMTIVEAQTTIEEAYTQMLDTGFDVDFKGDIRHIDLQTTGATDPDLIYDLISLEVTSAVQNAYQIGHQDNPVFQLSSAVGQLFSTTSIRPEFTLAERQITELIRDEFGEHEYRKQPTDFLFSERRGELSVEIIEGRPGEAFDFDLVMRILEEDAKDFHLKTLHLAIVTLDDLVSVEDAETLIEQAIDITSGAPLTLTYTSDVGKDYSWKISNDDLMNWIIPVSGEDVFWSETEELAIGIEEEQMGELFDEIRDEIDINPINAKFELEDGKVVNFLGSQEGVSLNEEGTANVLMVTLQSENRTASIVADTVQPDVKTGDVNDLGITEVIGVGTSDFSGSDWNRIQNIKHGASKINGLLIPPGETTGLVKHLRPFTLADGYFIGYSIIGDEIKEDVGGGLCQIGTTTFRAAMNSGLTIEQRRNHSLVVSYYDDPSNGNPGTDATLYDTGNDNTVVDLVITNDTENYVLLQTEVDEPNRSLTFSFWGTSDGRKGYYTPPQVLSRTGYGETVYKETTDIAPGTTKCQIGYNGASTSFDYIVEYADGTTNEQNFSSYYRALPRICLVGIDPDAPEELEVEDIVE